MRAHASEQRHAARHGGAATAGRWRWRCALLLHASAVAMQVERQQQQQQGQRHNRCGHASTCTQWWVAITSKSPGIGALQLMMVGYECDNGQCQLSLCGHASTCTQWWVATTSS